MKIKKISIFLCALLLSYSIMTGCSSQTNEQPSDTTASVSETTETVISTTAISENEITAETSQDFRAYANFNSGFFDKPIELELSCPAYPEAKIYYTTDGSVPTEQSTLYTAPITLEKKKSEPNVLAAQTGTSAGGDFIPRKNVDKAHTIRAIAVLPDGSVSYTANYTYFIGMDRAAKYGSVPVISIMTDIDNLFDYETGIYVLGKTYDDWLAEDPGNKKLEAWQKIGNYSNSGKDWERPVVCEYIAPDGTVGFSQDMGMRIMGGASRNDTQKSLRLIAREEYGQKSVKYEIIPDNLRSDGTENVSKYKSFALRNGGNDASYLRFRDPLFQSLIYERRVETQQTTPCVVYLNGEYWGMYTITEDYSDNYFENNYGIDNKNIVLLKCNEIEDGEETDIDLYYEMYDFIIRNDMSSAENYAKASEMLDMGSYIDYCAFNFYIYNEDSIFDDNNWRMWRVRTPDNSSELADGKWRMAVYDTDFSAGIYSGGTNYKTDNISKVLKTKIPDEIEERLPVYMFISLMNNEEFRKELVLTLCDMRNFDFESKSAIEKAQEYYQTYSKLVPNTFERFGPDWVAHQNTKDYYYYKLSELAAFIDGRYANFHDLIKKAFSLGDAVQGEIKSTGGGSITVNNTALGLDQTVKGKYFTDYTVTVTAVPDSSSSFKEWKCSGCEIIGDSTSPNAEIKFSGDFTIEAVFE